MSSPAFAIKLFELPYVAYKCVVQNMGNDMFELLKCSKRANSHVRICKVKLGKLIIVVNPKLITLALETCSGEPYKIKISEKSWDDGDIPVEKFFGGVPLLIAYEGTDIITCTSENYKNRMASYNTFIKWIGEMFRVNSHEFFTTCTRGNTFLKLCLSNIEFNITNISFSMDCEKFLNPRIYAPVLKSVLERDQVKTLRITGEIAKDFNFSEPISHKKQLLISRAHWVTYDNLKSLKCDHISLHDTNFTDDELNMYLKSILCGEVTVKNCYLKTKSGKHWIDDSVLLGIIPNTGETTYYIPHPGHDEPLKVSILHNYAFGTSVILIQASS